MIIVLTVCKKDAQKFKECIKSLTAQSQAVKDSLYFVIIMDGLTDSVDLSDLSGYKFACIKGCMGLCAKARNAALKFILSNADFDNDYVAFVDADDLVSPNYCVSLVQASKRNSDIIFIHNHIMNFDQSRSLSYTISLNKDKVDVSLGLFDDVRCATRAIKVSLLKSIGLFYEVKHEDIIMTTLLADKIMGGSTYTVATDSTYIYDASNMQNYDIIDIKNAFDIALSLSKNVLMRIKLYNIRDRQISWLIQQMNKDSIC